MAPARNIRYADSGGLQIAYEVTGSGPIDILVAFEWGANIDIMVENPGVHHLLNRFGEFGRVIHFDMRGVGLSDPVENLPPLEDWVDDIRAVMSAAGSERAALIGQGHAAQLCLLFAAMHPDQTAALVTLNGYARLRRAPDYPWGYPPNGEGALIAIIESQWGTGVPLGSISPDLSKHNLEWWAKLERAAGSPRRAARKQRLVFEVDVRDVLPAISAPTLVIHSAANEFVSMGHARLLADSISDARLLELPGRDHAPGHTDLLTETIEEFLIGTRHAPASDRALMTVAFTDIVESTRMAAELGDRRWRSLLEVHDTVARREIEIARGRLVKSTGDGSMATFDGPARAVQCMRSIGQELEPLGLPIRAGVHTGEVELMGDDIGGIAVHVAARIAALADAGEVLTSSTVRDLVAGSGLTFEDRGEHALKGVPEPWRVFAASA